MWIKRTPEELTQLKAKRQRARWQVAALIGLLTLLGGTFTHSRYSRYRMGGGTWLVSKEEIPSHFRFAFPAAMLMSGLAYWINLGRSRGSSTVICPKCESTKYVDSNPYCTCGGAFVEIETMKWVDGKEISRRGAS